LEYATLLLWLVLPFAGGARAKKIRGRIARNALTLLLICGAFAAAVGTIGCASGGSGTTGTTTTGGPQTYNITVTATMGTAKTSTNVSLTIQ
jgi:hypothetical protein